MNLAVDLIGIVGSEPMVSGCADSEIARSPLFVVIKARRAGWAA